MKEIIKTILYDWTAREMPPFLLPRAINLAPYLGLMPRKIITLTGFRRSGKTYLGLYTIERLLKKFSREEVIYINFEDERIPLRTDFLTNLLPTIKEVFGKPPKILFLDEVQNIPQWGKWLRRVYDENPGIIFFVTGSSSKMSSQEIPTELRGRCLEIKVSPLSFSEFLDFKNIKINLEAVSSSQNQKAELSRALNEYLHYGALPEVVLSHESRKMEILQQYYQTVIQKDIVERFKIKNQEGLKALLRLLLNSTAYSFGKLYNTLKSLNYRIGKTTLLNYVSHIETSYFLESLPIFSYKIKDQLQYSRKAYFIDNGFINALSTNFSENLGRLAENLVFIDLRREANNQSAFFYWKDVSGKEIDFVIKQGLKIKQLLQVCWDIFNVDTKKREVSALIKASEELRCDNLLIITGDYEAKEKIKNQTISYIPLWRWLLQEKN